MFDSLFSFFYKFIGNGSLDFYVTSTLGVAEFLWITLQQSPFSLQCSQGRAKIVEKPNILCSCYSDEWFVNIFNHNIPPYLVIILRKVLFEQYNLGDFMF